MTTVLEYTLTRGFIRVATGRRHHQRIVLVGLMAECDFGSPVIAQLLLDVGKDRAVGNVPVTPASRRIQRARELGLGTVAVEQRLTAVGSAIGLVDLIIDTRTKQRVFGQVSLKNPIGDFLVGVVVVTNAVLFLQDADEAPTQRTSLIDRPPHIDLAAIKIASANTLGHRRLKLPGGLFAHQVDGGRR
ncbi:hypothetical protein D3C84_647010 [compost metagenome]